MKIGILGSGAVGIALAKGFLAESHEVVIATRQPDSDKGAQLKAELPGATVADFETAAREAELAAVCVKSTGVEVVAKAAAQSLAGKTVIDTTNVITPADGLLLYGGGEESMAERIQSWLPDSQVVKAFNTTGADNMYRPDFGNMKPTMFVAGSDAEAKHQVMETVSAFGWDGLDLGDLRAARLLEPMALVWINYAMQTGERHHAFKML